MLPKQSLKVQRVKSKGKRKLKGKKDNSDGLEHAGRVKTSSNAPYWPIPKECHVDTKEAQGDDRFYTECTQRESTNVSITDCHAGNPCETNLDQTAQDDSPMIEIMKGTD
ncbi:hypothetical protein Tco_0409773 [Tanacetum coccineum]